MRKITALLNITRDGFMAGKNGNLDWHFPYWDEELCNCLLRELGSKPTLLLGRNTYEGLSANSIVITNQLNASKTDLMIAEILSSLKKIVITSRPVQTPWRHSVFVNNDFLEQLPTEMPMGNIVVLGSRRLLALLLNKDLLTHYELWQHPVHLLSGLRINSTASYLYNFEQTKCMRLSSGVQQISYRRR